MYRIANELARFTHRLTAPQLTDPNRGAYIREVILEPRLNDLIIPTASSAAVPIPRVVREAVQRHQSHPIGRRGDRVDGHAAFARS